MCKKRPALIQIDFSRPTKRFKLAHNPGLVVSPVEFMLPVQSELGPFWVTSGAVNSLMVEQRHNTAVEASCSLGSWGGGLSVSLVHRSNSGPFVDVDEEDTQDTASSEDSMPAMPRSCTHASRQPRAAATGEDDSITSNQPHTAASAAFSFGSRPCLTPDLTAVECWDILNGLLAAM